MTLTFALSARRHAKNMTRHETVLKRKLWTRYVSSSHMLCCDDAQDRYGNIPRHEDFLIPMALENVVIGLGDPQPETARVWL